MKKTFFVLLLLAVLGANTTHASIPEVPKDLSSIQDEVKDLFTEYLHTLLETIASFSDSLEGEQIDTANEIIIFIGELAEALHE